ncbi:MAG: carbon-nitrogen hydrolase family protein [bacterium]
MDLVSKELQEKAENGLSDRKIRVGACQILNTNDVQRSTERVIEKVKEASEKGIEILSFPEGTLFGYCCDEDYWKDVTSKWFSDAEDAISRTCKDYNIAVVVGCAYRSGDNWINCLSIFDNDGTLKYRYGKTFLAGEKWCINNKGYLPIVNLAGVNCCFIICHDIRYPELVRLPASMGAQICFFCSCESGLTEEYKLSAYRAMPISRATENGIYLVMANAPADEKDIRSLGSSHGNSKIIDPDGNVITEAGYFSECIVMADIDLSKATCGIARRAIKEDTIMKEWLNDGLKFVIKIS